MTHRLLPSRKAIARFCGEIDPDDGIDPRHAHARTIHARSIAKNRSKARRLCGQVADTLIGALGAQPDDVLQSLTVVSVDPAPDTSRLLVTVAPPAWEWIDPCLALERLDRAAPRLRVEVAAAITRRKAPALAFRVALPKGP